MTAETIITISDEYTDNDILRFFDKVELPDDLGDKDACWWWRGGKHSKERGYGKFWLNGKMVNAHKASYLLFRGRVPAGKVVAHQCNHESCVSPWHLEAETQKQNMEYCVASGRHNSQK